MARDIIQCVARLVKTGVISELDRWNIQLGISLMQGDAIMSKTSSVKEFYVRAIFLNVAVTRKLVRRFIGISCIIWITLKELILYLYFCYTMSSYSDDRSWTCVKLKPIVTKFEKHFIFEQV